MNHLNQRVRIRGRVWQKTLVPLCESREHQIDLWEKESSHSWASVRLKEWAAATHCCLSQQENLGAKPSGKDLQGPQAGLLEGGDPPASLAGLTDHTASEMWGPGLQQASKDRNKQQEFFSCFTILYLGEHLIFRPDAHGAGK